MGSPGVGKTHLAKKLAEYLFDSANTLIRIDMSEFMEKFTVSRLVGAPPGYVGYEEGGQLTEAVRRKPYSVVLFDEVEKAHPDVFNIFLQILDDGRVTDSQGRLIDFKNTVIILTSNLGSHYILDSIARHGEITADAREEVDKILKQHFRPEFLNRLDEIICFKALEKDVVYGIVELILQGVINRIKEKSSVYAAVDLAVELMFNSNLNPAVIRAAKDLKELNIYLDCLYENEVEKFDCFKIIYKVLPKIK